MISPEFPDIIRDVPFFALVLARIGAATSVLPGLGETTAPASAKIGLAVAITVLLYPGLPPANQPVYQAGFTLALMIIAEVITGLWFGWIVRLIALALPIGGQFIAYLIGLSSVLQPDPEIGSQASAFAKLFAVAGPVIVLASGLYMLPIKALNGLFLIIPVGHFLPPGDGISVGIKYVAAIFGLALQVASPFVVVGIAWQFAMGQVARASSRMQIYFISMPGQILVALVLLSLTINIIIVTWHDVAGSLMAKLPGS